jgi:hypothetical protein
MEITAKQWNSGYYLIYMVLDLSWCSHIKQQKVAANSYLEAVLRRSIEVNNKDRASTRQLVRLV